MISLMDFITVVILAFSIVLVMAGVFTAYFGNGKSRTLGILMFIGGIVVAVLWVFLCNGFGMEPIIKDVNAWAVFVNAAVDLIGVLIGAIAAVAIFLVAILKS